VVYVPHPIQNRTQAEIDAIADQAFAKVMAALVSSSSPGARHSDGAS
jgi:hypothetical protein